MVQTLELLKEIPGGRDLIDWLGRDTDAGAILHDSEILELCLNRSEGSKLLIMALKYTEACPVERIVTLHLKDVMHVDLQGFSHQNVVGGIEIARAVEREIHPSLLGIGIWSPDQR